ncbi:hypothetical protein NE237_017693 [Protea cynaroides]|uniref:F-box protein n=1 Tax=Protea cynaroides TaxID=273540 RepID=A0A9Q0K8H9_9MAGN|nr:hypothetical protein NE237_017693 [Protea cynaroides]
MEILVKLPIKSLVRFKCVSKDWFTMISDPLFAEAQLQQVKPVYGLIYQQSLEPGILSYFNLQKGKGKQIDFNVDELSLWETLLRDSCNGLLLLHEHFFDHQFYVYNLIIQWHLKLPPFLPGYKIKYSWSSLVDDNSNHKYKVVITFKKLRIKVSDTVSYKCGVFTLGDREGGGDGNSWRVLDMPTAYKLAFCKPLSLNGALHWMTYIKSEERTEVDGYVLLMDIAHEKCREQKFDYQFYVCNPIIQWHLKLPKFCPGYKIHSWSSLLVYDNSNHKYKIVITFCDIVSYKCGVFTPGDKDCGGDGNSCGFWRALDMPADYKLTYCEPLSVNGAWHWMDKKSEEERTEVDIYVLLMDIASEEFRVIKSPIGPTLWWLLALLEIKGSLCLFCPVSFDQVDLWLLSDTVKHAWNKQFSINYRLLISESRTNQNLVFRPLVVMKNPSPVIIFFCYLKEELIFYNLDTGEFKVEHKGISVSSKATVNVNSLTRC